MYDHNLMGHMTPYDTSAAATPAPSTIAGNVDARSRYSTATVTALADGDAGVAQTIAIMRAGVIEYRVDPYVHYVAGSIVAPQNPADSVGQARAVYNWVRENLNYRFVKDPVNVEWVQSPRITLEWGFGDCDCITTTLATMLESVGLPVRFVTVSLEGLPNPDGSAAFDHIYSEVLAGGQWIPIDVARSSPQFGVATTRVFRRQEWPIDLDATPDQLAGSKVSRSQTLAPSRLNGAIAHLGDGEDDGGWTDYGPPIPDDYQYYDPAGDRTYTLNANGDYISYGGKPESGSGTQISTGMTAAQLASLIAQGGNSAAVVIRAINTPNNPMYNPQSPYFGMRVPPTTSNFLSRLGGTNGLLIGALVLFAVARK